MSCFTTTTFPRTTTNILDDDGDSSDHFHRPVRNDETPYNPPPPLDLPSLDSDTAVERPAFDTPPPMPKESLLLKSGGVVPASIAQWLRTYQVEGVEFMYKLYKDGRGGILGDDMGLGSTFPQKYRRHTCFACACLLVMFGAHVDGRNGSSYRVSYGRVWKEGK